MTVKCPHCGLEGKAEEAILNKKIRCPKCRQIFIAVDAAAEFTAAEVVPQESEKNGLAEDISVEQAVAAEENLSRTELGETITDDDIALFEDEAATAAAEVLPEGVFRCICCGFVFSNRYKQESSKGVCCVACNVTEDLQPEAA